MRLHMTALGGFAFFALGIVLVYSSGSRVLFPFHTGTLDPWKVEAPEWVKDEPRNFNVGDKHTIIHPDLVFTLQQKKSWGTLGWNPYNFAGLPHAANPLTAVWYPPNFIFRLTDPYRAYGIVAALHAFLLAYFTFLFLRSIDVGHAAAFIGGLGTALGGWATVHWHHSYFVHTFTWLPLGLYAIERFSRGHRIGYAALLAVAIAGAILAGFPQTAVINIYVWMIWAAVAIVTRAQPWKRRGRRAALLFGFALIGFGLAAIQWLPTLDYLGDAGHRGQTLDDLRADALLPVSLFHLLLPDLFGHPSTDTGTTSNFFAAWLLGGGRFDAGTPNSYSERSFFAGTLLLLLAFAAPFLRRRRPEIVLSVLSLLAVATACDLRIGGISFLAGAVKLPGLGFGSPMRLTQVAGFALPVLGAISLDRIFALSNGGSKKLAYGGIALGIAVFFPVLCSVTALWIAPSYSAERFTALLMRFDVHQKMGVGQMSAADIAQSLAAPLSELRRGATVFCAALGATAAFLTAAGRGKKLRVLVAAAIAIVALELGYFAYRFNLPVSRRDLYSTPCAGIDFMKSRAEGARFIRFGRGDDDASFFIPNAAQIWGLKDAQGFRALAPQRYLEFMRTMEPNPYDIGLLNFRNVRSFDRPQLDFLRVKYAVASGPIDGMKWPLVFPTDPAQRTGLFVYENQRILPRAFVAPDLKKLASDQDVLSTLATLDPSTDAVHPLRRTVYTTDSEPIVGRAIGSVDPLLELPRVSEDIPGRITVELDGRFTGTLVVPEGWSSNWRVEAMRVGQTNEKRKAMRVNHAFLGTPVDTTYFRVSFVYDPPLAVTGVWATIASAIVLVATLVLLNWRRFFPATTDPAPESS